MSLLEGMQMETWDDAALVHTLRVWNHRVSGLATTPVEEIRLMVDFMIDHYFHGNNELEDDSCWLDLGALALKAHPFTSALEVSRILSKKQRDYGPNNIARFAEKGLILRLHDKIARLENLLEKQYEASNESIEDTYLDIIGYSVIGMMWMNEDFFKPLREE